MVVVATILSGIFICVAVLLIGSGKLCKMISHGKSYRNRW